MAFERNKKTKTSRLEPKLKVGIYIRLQFVALEFMFYLELVFVAFKFAKLNQSIIKMIGSLSQYASMAIFLRHGATRKIETTSLELRRQRCKYINGDYNLCRLMILVPHESLVNSHSPLLQ